MVKAPFVRRHPCYSRCALHDAMTAYFAAALLCALRSVGVHRSLASSFPPRAWHRPNESKLATACRVSQVAFPGCVNQRKCHDEHRSIAPITSETAAQRSYCTQPVHRKTSDRRASARNDNDAPQSLTSLDSSSDSS